MRIHLLAVASFVAVMLAGSAMLSAQTTAPAGDVAHGRQLFETNGCYLCHNHNGLGTGTRRPINPGPGLAPAPIPYPAFVKQVRTPRGTMPPYDAKLLSDKDLSDIYAFLASQPPAKDARTIPLLNVVNAGSPGNTPYGAVVYYNDCSMCHGASGQGGAGPSLRNESAKRDAAAVAALIRNPPAGMTKLYPGLMSAGDVTAVAQFVETLK